jgi:hypothetical protein
MLPSAFEKAVRKNHNSRESTKEKLVNPGRRTRSLLVFIEEKEVEDKHVMLYWSHRNMRILMSENVSAHKVLLAIVIMERYVLISCSG